MLPNINHPNPQGESGFFQKLTLDIRRLIYLELFGSRPVHVTLPLVPIGSSDVHQIRVRYFICQKPKDQKPHPLCVPVNDARCRLPTRLLYTCQQAFLEGFRLMAKSKKLIFENPAELTMFHAMSPFRHHNLIRDLGLCVQAQHSDDVSWVNKLGSRPFSFWKGDIRVRMRWETYSLDAEEALKKEVAKALSKMMKNRGTMAMLWMSKNLQEAVKPLMAKQAYDRLEFIELDGGQPDNGDLDDGWDTDMMEDEMQDQLEYEREYGSDAYRGLESEDDSEDYSGDESQDGYEDGSDDELEDGRGEGSKDESDSGSEDDGEDESEDEDSY